ncbi:MAG: hypothetical protein WC179_03605 [Candidatus Cloacimonadaceae bacterium]|jgi:hypothetical protein|nr:hypothetical protein [Candidatus Cloacimonadota bacterium]MDD5624731.1 hypothetical protein [Candidatus Cloacimonadota bacterium]MDY0111669.1 hypothetical protein [Candidatus Syntrophosphaera sp.]
MSKIALIIIIALMGFCLFAETHYPIAEPEIISSQIVNLIDISEPIFLDIQAGDFTSSLEYHIRHMLLEKGADIRELNSVYTPYYLASLPDSLQKTLLPLSLSKAHLIEISMELTSTKVETKKFLSYYSERYPLYNFQIRQIELPSYKLLKVDNLSFADTKLRSSSSNITSLKWFEPLLAVTAISSIIYLLWTIE